jgi:hypothetical protein
LIDRTGGSDEIHEVRAPPVRADGKAAANDLAETRQVGAHIEQLLRPACGRAEARDHLIEDEQRILAIADAAKALEKAVTRRHEPHVACDWLDEDGRNLSVVGLEESLDRIEVVESCEQRIVRNRNGHTGTGRNAERRRARPCLDEERIRVSVIAPFELDDAAALRCRAGDPQRAHGGLGAGVDEPNAFHRGHQQRHALREACLEMGRRPEARPVRCSRCKRFDETVGRVSVNERAPRHHVIDVRVTVHILEVRAAGALDENGICADRLERTYGTVHAARQDAHRFCEELLGFRMA